MAGEPESLDTDESLERRQRRHAFDRIIMLSDGVFAIAMTLLAFDLRPPARWTGVADLWAQMGQQLNAYAMSFVVISVYWLAHKRFMAMMLAVDAPVTVINLFVLALVALLPSTTQLAISQARWPQSMLFYGALVVSIGAVMAVLWGYASLKDGLVSPEVPPRVRWFLFALMLITPPLFLGLSQLIPNPSYGAVPAALVCLFVIGWRMRMWVLRRLEPAAGVKPPPVASADPLSTP
jgi:uncharacterized membrane protein